MAEYLEGKTDAVGEGKETKVAENTETVEEGAEASTEVDPADRERKDRARAQGWKPKKEWIAEGGDPAQWRSAREFLDRGELLKVIKDTKYELRKVGEVVTNLSEHNKQVYMAGYKNALQQLKAAKVTALENDNHAAVVEIDDRIDETKRQLSAIAATPVQQVTAQPVQTDAFQEFLNENPWYSGDEDLQFWAHGTAIKYAKEHPNATEREVYKYLGKAVKERHPERFTGRKGPPSPDGAGRSGSQGSGGPKGSGSFEKLMASLPEEQAKAARTMVKMGVISKEKYVEDYEAIGANR